MCVNLKAFYDMMTVGTHRVLRITKRKARLFFMNKNKQKTAETTLHKVLPLLGMILFIASLFLLLTLPSCSRNFAGIPSDETTATDTTTGEGQKETEPPTSDTAGSISDVDRETLLYYVSLVEELQEEIRALKAENFILSTTKPETDAPVSKDPAALYTYEIKDGEITILSYVGNETEVTVPREIEGCPVVQIGESAFSGTGVVSVVLPDTVVSVDWFAFSSCTSLRSVTAGDSITSVGYGAFDGCPAALTLICPDGSYLSKYGKSFGIAVKAE